MHIRVLFYAVAVAAGGGAVAVIVAAFFFVVRLNVAISVRRYVTAHIYSGRVWILLNGSLVAACELRKRLCWSMVCTINRINLAALHDGCVFHRFFFYFPPKISLRKI